MSADHPTKTRRKEVTNNYIEPFGVSYGARSHFLEGQLIRIFFPEHTGWARFDTPDAYARQAPATPTDARATQPW